MTSQLNLLILIYTVIEKNETKLTKFSHECDPRLEGNLIDVVQSACISLLQLRHLPPA